MDLAVTSREITGKKVRSLRKEGLIPAELYGRGIKNVHLAVPAKDFNKVLKESGTTTVVTLMIGKEKRAAMIHDVGRDFLTGDIIHVDFHEIRMDEKITAKVPLEFTGDAPAVKEKGAVVNKSMSEIEVEALPILARGSALRFMLTRLVDWLNVPPGAKVTPKNPLEYVAKMRFHQRVVSARDYGRLI